MLRRLLAKQTNEPLDREKLRSSLVRCTPPDALPPCRSRSPGAQKTRALVFVATENYFNGAISVDGTLQKTNPKPHQLTAASQLDLGDFFSEEKVARSIERMKKVLADNGYYQASITYTLEPNPETRQMAIHFHVEPGRCWRESAR